ncbi:MAG TPA: hypothetical protein VJ756_09365 [Terriglobales bacterium]|nr:hypothetical protein [Terriglobales bacterium]
MSHPFRFSGKLLLVMLALVAMATAQSVPAAPSQGETGFTSYVEFDGTSNAEGQVYRLNSSVGYSFTQHFGVDVGIPVYFVRPSSSVSGTTGSASGDGLGNPYLDLRLKFLNPALNFGSVLTGYAPAGDSKLGLSTGRATFDWTNHFDHSFNNLTPFFEAGLSNTVADTQLFLRPFTSLGMNSHFQGGASYQLGRYFNLGVSGYDIQPFGQQTIFSKVANGSSQARGSAGASSHGPFQNNQQVTGASDLAYDNGFSAWIGASPSPFLDMQLGYTRSIQYDLNSVSFGIGVNVGRLYHRSASK